MKTCRQCGYKEIVSYKLDSSKDTVPDTIEKDSCKECGCINQYRKGDWLDGEWDAEKEYYVLIFCEEHRAFYGEIAVRYLNAKWGG